METGVNLWVTIVLCLGLCMGQEVWEAPYFEETGQEGVWFSTETGDVTTTIYMFEEIAGDFSIATILYSGSEPSFSFMFPSAQANNFLGAEFRRGNDNRWSIVVTKIQDYENNNLGSGQRYQFRVAIGSENKIVVLQLVNINDHQPSIIADNAICNIEENSLEPPACNYLITDEDGWLDDVGWTLSEYSETFAFFDGDNRPQSNLTQEMQTYLYNQVELDFEQVQMYLFDWTVLDTGTETLFERTLRIVVQVTDLPDTPPMWRSIFASQEFDEKEKQEFGVLAVDGDIGINAEIFYFINNTEWDEYIQIDRTTGKILVSEIDRDKHSQEIYTFTINACEVEDEDSCISQNVIFIVNDINDNVPKIKTEKTSFEIPEHSVDLEIVVNINDIDLGDNAMYTVQLQNDEPGTEFHEAFSVVPSRGYQDTDVFVFIINSTILDYEEEEWRSFEFQLEARETQDPTHVDVVTFQINLKNINDEFPIFEKEEYEVSIEETVGEDVYIDTVHANDRDFGDWVSHELLGVSISQRFNINETSGIITTKLERSLDYETQSEVIVQVQATDHLLGGGNRAVAQLTIKVIDVNDETPRISVASGRIEIFENRPDGELINDETVTATDEDTDADLSFSIDWDKSYATKSGQRIDANNFTLYILSVSVETVPLSHTGAGAYVSAKMTIKETQVDNTPDFELFDALFIYLVVTDMNQVYGSGEDSVIVPIYVLDVNDEAPVFADETITSVKSVNEHSAIETLIGVIIATDVDGPTIDYYLTAVNNTPDGWVHINDRGELRVSSTDIDADEPLWYLYYEVMASDGPHTTTADIVIEINDLNDNIPEFITIQDKTYVDEKSPSGTSIQTIKATDADRDAPNNVVSYYFNDGVNDFFSLDQESGEFAVQYANEAVQLDRDNEIPAIVIDIRVHARDGGNQRSDDGIFTVTLLDINDNDPIIETPSISTGEQLQAEEVVGQITATDKDEPNTDNTKIKFEILGIHPESIVEKDPPTDLPMFYINVVEEYSPAMAELKTSIPLREYYGTYLVTVETTDFGEGDGSTTTNVSVIIDKYNFEQPTISDPSNGEIIYLAMAQQLGGALIKYNGEYLETITATDNQGEKWTITFSVDEGGADLFTINSAGHNAGYLTLITDEFVENEEYQLNIIAQDNGTPTSLSATMPLRIKFVDETAEPVFIVEEEYLKFTENQTVTQTSEFSKAQYEGIGADLGFPVYYSIITDPTGSFKIDSPTDNRISLSEPLDREENCCYVLILGASRQSTGSSDSRLTLNIELEDINDNPPNFDSKVYFATIMPSYTQQNVILTVSATDLDDTSELTYSINQNSFVSNGTNINMQTPFVINSNTGAITTNFAVASNMNGFFKFVVEVTDGDFKDDAAVQVYIVNELHRVEFIFQNDSTTVEQSRAEIVPILVNEFGYECNIEVIQKNTDGNGEPIDGQTVVAVHFINSDTNEPVLATEIERKANDLEVYSRLRAIFRATVDLELLSFSQNMAGEDNTADILRGWLIGVSVVLGTLCVILLVAFILKVRSLSSRLNKLSVTKYGSQESGLNRKAAPTTNLHAAEGTNPAFAEEKKMPDFDETSIGSADSDLVGVENNPEFQYNNGSAPPFANNV